LDGDDEVAITPDVSAEQGFGAHRACVEPLRRTVVNETMSLSPPKEEQAKDPCRARQRAVEDEAVSDSTRQATLRGSGRSSLSSGREYEPFWHRASKLCLHAIISTFTCAGSHTRMQLATRRRAAGRSVVRSTHVHFLEHRQGWTRLHEVGQSWSCAQCGKHIMNIHASQSSLCIM
jgi:hypothetical protein